MATRRKKTTPEALAPGETAPEIIAEAPAVQTSGGGTDDGREIPEGIEGSTPEEVPDTGAPTTIENLDLTADQMPAEVTRRESKWPESTERRTVIVPLDEHDLAEKSKEMAEIIMERDRTKMRAKNAAAAYKAEVDELDERLGIIAVKVDGGGDEKSVECEWHYETYGYDGGKFTAAFPGMPVNFADTGLIFHPEYKTLVRLDNGEAIEVGMITTEERQMDLSLLPAQPEGEKFEIAEETAEETETGDGIPDDDGAAMDPITDPGHPDDQLDEEVKAMTPEEQACFDLGWGAWDLDAGAEENPYPEGSAQSAAWLKGWTASKEAAV
jgi:hypothetical protein